MITALTTSAAGPAGAAGDGRVLEGELVTPEEEAAAWSMFIEHKLHSFSPEEEAILLGAQGPTKSGVMVSAASALKVAAVFGCCRVIAEDTAKLPVHLFEIVDGAGTTRRKRRDDHPLQDLIEHTPNDWMSGYELREYMTFIAALYGRSHAFINQDPKSGLIELLPLLPGAVQERQLPDWTVERIVVGYGGAFKPGAGELLTLRGVMASPTHGFEPIVMAREAIGLSVAIEAAVGKFHANDMRPSGVLSIELGTNISQDQIDRIRADWQERFRPGGTGGLAILDKKFDYKPMTATSADNDTVDQRKFEIEEICRYFRVSPQKLFHPGQAAGYNGLEQINQGHYVDTIMPWVKRWEGALKRDVIQRGQRPTPITPNDSPEERQAKREKLSLYFALDMDAVARGTFGDRVNAYTGASKVYLTPNEIRERENLDPIDDDEMNQVQLQRNNTGTQPGSAQPSPKPAAAKPAASDQGKPY